MGARGPAPPDPPGLPPPSEPSSEQREGPGAASCRCAGTALRRRDSSSWLADLITDDDTAPGGSALVLEPRERRAAGVARGVVQLLLDAHQLVVLGHPVRAGRGAGLDLAAVHR